MNTDPKHWYKYIPLYLFTEGRGEGDIVPGLRRSKFLPYELRTNAAAARPKSLRSTRIPSLKTDLKKKITKLFVSQNRLTERKSKNKIKKNSSSGIKVLQVKK